MIHYLAAQSNMSMHATKSMYSSVVMCGSDKSESSVLLCDGYQRYCHSSWHDELSHHKGKCVVQMGEATTSEPKGECDTWYC